jgi:hypothetical protein
MTIFSGGGGIKTRQVAPGAGCGLGLSADAADSVLVQPQPTRQFPNDHR